MNRLEAMSTLLAAVDAGSLSAASRKLGIPLATVSRRVSDLEAVLRTKILVRTSRRLELTDAGRSYVVACRDILAAVDQAERTAAGEYAAPKGDIVVTAPIVFGRLHVLPVIVDFLRAYPEIDVRLMLTDRVTNFVEDHVDVALRIGTRGLGLSAKPAGGFDKKTQARDLAGVLDTLNITRCDLVTHDIGNMVGFAFSAQYPQRVNRFMPIDAPVPGVGPWDEILKNPLLWHFRFGGPDMERLVAGRERIYFDRFWNEFSADPKRFTEAAREHYASLYALPGAMHSGFMQFAAFDQDAVDNTAFLTKGKLQMPVLAVGGEKSFGAAMADVMRFAASDVTAGVVPDAGHWIMEENPAATIVMTRKFLG